MSVDIIGLRQQRATAYDDMTGLLAAAGNRAMTDEEQATYDAAVASVEGFDRSIRNAERATALRASTAIPAPVLDAITQETPTVMTVPASPAANDEKGLDFARYTRAIVASKGDLTKAHAWASATFGEGAPVVADIGAVMQGNSAASGGIFIPERLSTQLIELLLPQTVIRRISRVVPLVGGTDTIPTVESGISAYYIGEGDDISTSEPTFGAMSFKEREIASLVPLSNKLIRLASVGIDQYVRDLMVQGFAQAEDAAFLRGTGVGAAPKGIRNYIPAANVVAATSSTTPTAVQVDSDTRKAVLALSVANIPFIDPRWLMHDRVFMYLQDLRDTNGNRFYPSLNSPNPTFRGYPVERFNRIPINLSDGTNADCSEIYFGDFAFSLVADSYTVRLDVSAEASYKVGSNYVSAFSKNQTLIRGLAAHDYGVTRTGAFYVLNNVRWGG